MRDEAARVQQVYRGYDNDAASRRRWDPSNPANLQFEREILNSIRDRLSLAMPLPEACVLDIGCGDGWALAELARMGANPSNLHGLDLRAEQVGVARELHPQFHFAQANAEKLDFPDGSFDLVVAFGIFSSILDEGTAARVAGAIVRVLRASGGVLWYDIRYNNPANVNVRGVSKQRLASFFPGFDLDLSSIVALPAIARRLGRRGMWLYPVLFAIPPLRIAYAGILRKPSQ